MSMMLLLRRWPLRIKFALMGIVSLVMFSLPTTLYLINANKTIDLKEIEWEGVEPSRQLQQLVRNLQQHRGLSVNELGGDSSLRARRQERAAESEKYFTQLLQTLTDDAGKIRFDFSELTAARQQWQRLRQQVDSGNLSAEASFHEHTQLVSQLLDVADDILDSYHLTLDDSLELSALIQGAFVSLPRITEELGKARAHGTRLLGQRSATDAELLSLAGMTQRAGEHMHQTQRAFAKAFALAPDILTTLREPERLGRQEAGAAVERINSQILQASSLSADAKAYFDAQTRAIDAQFALVDGVIQVIDQRLDAQVSALERQELLLLGGLLLLGLLAVLLSRAIARSIGQPLQQSVALANQVAACDLTARVEVQGTDEAAQLLGALNTMSHSLSGVVAQVRTSIDSINHAASEIAAGNLDLSSRTEAQAANLEETAASVEELTSTVRQTAEHARQASTLATAAAGLADNGGTQAQQAIDLMQTLQGSSHRMAEVVSVIESIAFQTNILALNASVESARAGEQGRGFAVVATEVRSLAQRSAQAANEVKALINTARQEADTGTTYVQNLGQTMQQVVASIREVASLLGEIDGASQEQTLGITQVNQAVGQIDAITQQNAALVEEAAAAAANLRDQTVALADAVVAFRLEDTSTAPTRALLPG